MRPLARTWTAAAALALAGAVAPAGAEELEVVARKVTEAPAVDGKVDKAWDAARPTKVTASDGPQGDVEITVKAVYTDKDIYFLFQWADKTMSLGRLLEYTGKEWKPVKGNEDRLNVMWDLGVKDFAAKGCTAACHKQGAKVSLRTGGPGERADLWHWKAQRTNPAGYADDQWLGHEPGGPENVARASDQESGGGYASNWDAAAKRPRWRFKDGVKPGPVLLKKDAVELKDDSKFKAGDTLPREVLERVTGSRGDIEARGAWAGGRWTLELRRARETADKEHDVQFADPAKPRLFGIAVHDGAGDDEHSHTGRTVLKLMLK